MNNSYQGVSYEDMIHDQKKDDSATENNMKFTECCGAETTEETGHCPSCGEPI